MGTVGMRLLLDTHALLWWLLGDGRLAQSARDAIAGEESLVYVSAASAWEIATKTRIGKLPDAESMAQNLAEVVQANGFLSLPISLEHGQRAGSLPGSHKDPFDRMLIAQAQTENLILVSNEEIFDQYGITRLWERSRPLNRAGHVAVELDPTAVDAGNGPGDVESTTGAQ